MTPSCAAIYQTGRFARLAGADDEGEKIKRELSAFAAKHAEEATPGSTTSVRIAVYIDDERAATKQIVERYNVKLQLVLLRALRDKSPDFLTDHPVRQMEKRTSADHLARLDRGQFACFPRALIV